ncbi:hypothetical protein SLEP1_g47894 [Rubroshorea leprosula]|uniref:Uncharacterized protein n=1 Tax=Rubroshorea leprosula TaxID=152421 RepID=A0AAV5LUV9_9ROSI|nr:hypothetical protein SLEP1_g47894 [Rubroshorea leprosula]
MQVVFKLYVLLVSDRAQYVPGSSHDDILKVIQGVHSSVSTQWKWPDEKGFTETSVLSLDKILNKEKMDVEMLLRKINPDMDKLVFGEMDKLMSAEQKEALMDEFSRVTAACYLSRELLKHPTPWELISKVWVEIVCYAAINCKPIVHARQGKQADGDNFSLSFGY